MIGPMPWFAWLWCIGMAVCIAGILYCAADIGRSTRRIKQVQERRARDH
jgi:hypothetical protein